MEDLKGKIILVTGTSSGMGRATAVELARKGAKLICAARRPDRGAALAAEIHSFGGTADFVATDIGNEASINALFAFISERYGRLDGAFNNAAMEIDTAPLPDIPLADFDKIFAVNVRGTFHCMQHEMRMMRGQGSGAIVNTASVGGVTGLRNGSAYAASKHAVVGLTRSAALDGAAFGVRVNVICPGTFDTEMMERWTHGDPAIAQLLANFSPLKRVGQPIDIANAVLYLLSDLSSYTTGLVMNIDGGVTSGVPM